MHSASGESTPKRGQPLCAAAPAESNALREDLAEGLTFNISCLARKQAHEVLIRFSTCVFVTLYRESKTLLENVEGRSELLRTAEVLAAVKNVTAIKPVEKECIFKSDEASEAQDAANMQEIYDDMDFQLEGEQFFLEATTGCGLFLNYECECRLGLNPVYEEVGSRPCENRRSSDLARLPGPWRH